MAGNKSKVITAVDLWIPAEVEPKPDMSDKWEKVLHATAPLVNERRKAKIPDEAAYQNKIAEPEIQAWAPVLNPNYRSKSGRTYEQIKSTHDKNLQEAFSKWDQKLDRAYRPVDGIPGKHYQEQVTASKHIWAKKVAGKSLRLTGDRIRGEGAATIAVHWLIGEPSAVGMLRPQDTGVKGSPARVCAVELAASFTPALMGRLTQAGILIFNCDYASAVIQEENRITNLLIQNLVDPGLGLAEFAPGGASHLDYVKQGALFKLSLRVAQK